MFKRIMRNASIRCGKIVTTTMFSWREIIYFIQHTKHLLWVFNHLEAIHTRFSINAIAILPIVSLLVLLLCMHTWESTFPTHSWSMIDHTYTCIILYKCMCVHNIHIYVCTYGWEYWSWIIILCANALVNTLHNYVLCIVLHWRYYLHMYICIHYLLTAKMLITQSCGIITR